MGQVDLHQMHRFLTEMILGRRWGHGGRVVALLPFTSEAGGHVHSSTSSGKSGSCLPLVSSLQYRTLTNLMFVLVSSALPTTCRDMTCTVLKAM